MSRTRLKSTTESVAVGFCQSDSLRSHGKPPAVTCGSIDVLRLRPFSGSMILPAPEEPAQSCQALRRTAILSRIKRADQLEWPVRRGSLFKVCVRYSDTERRYNEYPVPATSARTSSNFQRDVTPSIRQKIRFKSSVFVREWLLPNRTMGCAGFSRKIICVFENASRGSLYVR
jgi:hypothetical protein